MVRQDDPSVAMLRSGLGKQPKSHMATEPAFGFGTSVRDGFNKQYVSPEHARVMVPSNSQGPVYKLYTSMGPQTESTVPSASTTSFGGSARLPKPPRSGTPGPGQYKPGGPALGEQTDSKRCTSPRTVFGTATRDARAKVFLDAELQKSCAGVDAPPPGAYTIPSGVGRQADSTKATAPGVRIGTSQRALDYAVRAAKHLPGAGAYNTYSGVGRQSLSNKKSLPIVGFGRGTRDATKKTFISKEHEKQAYGECSPGPATSNMYASYGPQLLSNRASSPGWGFGSSKRLKDFTNEAPGPGAYFA